LLPDDPQHEYAENVAGVLHGKLSPAGRHEICPCKVAILVNSIYMNLKGSGIPQT
jgi:hypothetical protein